MPGDDLEGWEGVHAWEKEMATHSSVLAWRIRGTVEPGGLPSMPTSQNVGNKSKNKQMDLITLKSFCTQRARQLELLRCLHAAG